MVSFHADRRRRSVRLSGEEGDRLCGKTNPLWKIQAAGRGRIFYINHNILKWLREPGKNFPPQRIHIPEGDSFEISVCVGSICDRAGLSQSVISKYLGMMESAGLLESARFGKWTYYRRNEENIRKFARYAARDL